MPGRPRKPTKLHVIEGTLRPNRHKGRENELELSGERVFPEPPQVVIDDPLALAEWARIVQSPAYSPVLAPEFFSIVVEYCLLTANMYRNYLPSDRGGRPQKVTDAVHLNVLRQQLGLTPAAQSKVKLPPKKKEANEFDVCDLG